ncbi:nectin-3-like protein [Sebastes umbrosus]|uniref:nectin-3-like protein n=1 Tax=Sebastes umbrosus TaxID=72105 RepID=UPI0018A107F4|nr:nectin-3-like protein [Sebastes umbrosus]
MYYKSTHGSTTMLLLVPTLIFLSAVIEGLQVIGGNTTVVQGGTAILPCKLIDTEDLSQISWRKKPHPDNFYTILPTGPKFVNGYDPRFKFIGNFSDNNGSIQLSDVKLRDEGTYECIFTRFPSGNVQTDVLLNLLVPPVTSLKDNLPTLGDEEVSLVTCVAAGSKPRADVKWITGTLAGKMRETNSSTQHANGTTTTVSSLFGVPTREINHHVVHCVVTSAAMSKEERRPFTIQVYFPPVEVNIIKRSELSFECVTEANPKANINWSRDGQSLPKLGVSAEGATLQFVSMTSDLNGLYQCEASNIYGKQRSSIYVHNAPGACSVCWTLFSILLLLMIAFVVAAVFYFYKPGIFPWINDRRGERYGPPVDARGVGEDL